MSQISELTAWFKSQIGTTESGINNVKYNTDYYGHEVNGEAFPWCVTFIWDGFRLCGLSSLFCGGIKTAYCPFVVNYAKSHNQWVTSGYREGELLLYDWDKDGTADHIGYCAGISGGNVYSIEGNTSDKVALMTRYHGTVMGAYRPAYTSGTVTAPTASEKPNTVQSATKFAVTLPMLKKGDKGEVVKAAQLLLIGRGFTVGGTGADGDYGNATYAGVVNYQTSKKLDADGIIGSATWQALLGVKQ